MKDLDGIRILLVEDEPDARWVLSRVFSMQHAEVRTAESADVALVQLKEEVPDILISDISMPQKDGYWLMRQVRRMFPALPAVALTALAAPEDKQAALEAGFQEHISKPFDFERLFCSITRLVQSGTQI